MKNALVKALAVSILSCAGLTAANAADISKAEAQTQVRICKGKQQGAWVSYNFKGVLFNGTCEPNENGALQFKAPGPNTPAPGTEVVETNK